MKNILKLLGLTCITTLVVLSSQANATVAYKITGEFIYIEPTVDEEPSEAAADAPEAPPWEPVDLSNAVLTISYETTTEEGEAETVTLYEGPYEEDFESVGEVAEPTEIDITLQVSEDSRPMTLSSVIGTGSDVHFAFIDREGSYDVLWLVGATDQVMDQENKFSVSGDLSFLDIDLTNTTSVEVYARVLNDEGKLQAKQWGPVLVKDKTFLIEGEVDRPLTAQLFIHGGHNTYTTIVLEPESEFVVEKLGDQTQEVSVTSGSGCHAALVESWQQSEEYIELTEAYVNEYDAYRKRREAGEPEPEVSDDEGAEVAENDSDSEDTENSGDAVVPAEGCEDAVAQESEIADSTYTPPRYVSLRNKTRDFRNGMLQEIVEGDGDPWTRYLAVEMHPYPVRDYASQLAAYRSLAEVLDEDFVAANLNPTIELLQNILVTSENDAKLIPGQKVPEFSLANYDGEDSSLYTLLADNDMVLIDFWASWCGPCIADFPELKKLHAAYTNENFEIVGVSIDDTEEDWKGGVDDHELPWINLGELKGWEGPVATIYGVNGIPKGFLVDSQGCIYKKNIRPAALKEFLVDRYGMDESLEEPEVETDDTQEVSS
ncbi:MAG: TlpA disulfide reductase family protein [Gammaproteobacteria bacterium]|nr:TlpA disulfide reductase family protein [Gammaproteobacteria bacterium]